MDISKAKRYNQTVIIGIFLFTVLNGAIRKWFIDNASINAVFAFLQIPILFVFLFLKSNSSSTKINLNILIIYVLYLIATAFNPLSPGIYHATSGIIIHLGFWLALTLYITKRDNFEIDYLFKLILIVIAAEIILGIMQYASPKDSFINRYAIVAQEDETEIGLNIATVGDAVRISGTFSYIAGYVSFILFLQLFNFSLFYNPKIRKEIPIYLSFFIIMLSFLTGSRACTLFVVVSSSSFFLWQYKGFKELKLRKYLIQFLLLLIINTGLSDPLNINNAIENSYNNFNRRLEDNAEEGEGRLILPFQRILNNEFPNKLLGNGLAISYPAIVALKGTSQVAIDHWVQDDEISRILLEGGYVLLLLKITLMVVLIHHLKINKIFSTVVFSIVFLYFPLSTNIYNSVFFLLGIIYLDQSIIKFNEDHRLASG